MSPRSITEYAALCRRLIKVVGRGRLVTDLRPDDFAKLRADMAKTWGPVRLKAEIIRARTPFNWAHKMKLIAAPIIFGEGFKVPSAKTLRKHRAGQGPKTFQADEIRRMLEEAGPALRAMILLGANCGFGNSDIATLTLVALDLNRGWIEHARPKTGIERRCPLWPETVRALRDWLAVRPEPKQSSNAGRVFVTKYGGVWEDDKNDRALSHEMRKLLDRLDITGRSFYSLRHGFQSIGDESGDFVAVRSLMGHAFSGDISAVYRERVSDNRRRKVTDFIRSWLFAPIVDTSPVAVVPDANPDPSRAASL